MADNKVLEREYVIPLRKQLLKVPVYRRAGRAVKTIKQFIAKHMKVDERDTNKVKIDVYFNNEVWMRGKTNPPTKVKVKATKEGDIVKVTFVEMPKRVSFLKAQHEKRHKVAEKVAPTQTQTAEKVSKEERTEDQKKDEKEKEQAVAQQNTEIAKQQKKIEKHSTKPEKAQRPQRMALQK